MTDLQTIWSSFQLELDAHRPKKQGRPIAAAAATPVTLLTGFLGAGKSTLLAELLTNPPEGIVVTAVVNDVGSLRFDPSFVVGGERLEIELANGCGCCASTTDLAETLDRLASAAPDVIVMEASGVADPLALAQVIEAGPAITLDRIVTVVDADAVRIQVADPTLGPIVRRQLDAAHVVIVTRTEAHDPKQIERLGGWLASLAQGATIATSCLDRLHIESLLPRSTRGARPASAAPADGHALATLTCAQVGSLSMCDLTRVLQKVDVGVIRLKGWLLVDGRTVQVQVAGGVGSWHEAPAGALDQHQVTIVAKSVETVDDLAASLGCATTG